MKTRNFLFVVALSAAAGIARAESYTYDLDVPAAPAAQDEVVVGEGDAESVPAPTMESYGVMPSWACGCCERQPSKADHLWDNYCYEGYAWGCGCDCCGKSYCGTGPFSKGCCCKGKGKCGAKCGLPKLHLLDHCCQKAKCCTAKVHRPMLLGHCCQKAKGCAKQTSCRKPLLSKLRLFRHCGGKCGKCGKGKAGEVMYGSTMGTDEVPVPAIEGNVIEMPSDVPPVPPMADPAA